MDEESAAPAAPAAPAPQPPAYSLARYEVHVQGTVLDPPPTDEALFDVLDAMWEKWASVSGVNSLSEGDTLERIMEAFGLQTVPETGDMTYEATNNVGELKRFRGLRAVEAAFYRAMKPLLMLYLNFVTADFMTSDHRIEGRRGVDDRRADTTYCRIDETIRQSFILLRAEYRRRAQLCDDLYNAHAPGAESASTMVSRDDFQLARDEKMTSYQWLLLFVLFDIKQHGLRKLDGQLYAEKTIPVYERVLGADGEPVCAVCGKSRAAHPTTGRGRRRHAFTTRVRPVPNSQDVICTLAWEPFHETPEWKGFGLANNDIETWVQLRCARHGVGGRQAWMHLTSKSNMAKDLAQQLSVGFDKELPELRVDRAVWSFQNGIFLGETGEFVEYASETFRRLPDYVSTKYCDLWFDHEAMVRQLLGRPTAGPTAGPPPSRPPSARFEHVLERKFCLACGRQDLFHPAACKADRWELRCAECERPISACRCTVCPTCGGDEEDGCAADCVDAGWRGGAGGVVDDAAPFFYPYQRHPHSYMNIATPWMDSILRFQALGDTPEEEREVWRWAFIMLGRLFFPVHKRNDDWQVCFFIKGQANTGKSTIADWVQRWMLPRNVAILSNNAQDTFGMQDLLNHDGSEKQLVLCLETKADFTLPQAALQSMITGEAVQVTRKHERSTLIPRWSCPLFLLGNELPGLDPRGGSSTYKDNSGSLSRRFVILEFAKELTDDQRYNCLGSCLYEAEGPALLAKILLAYNEARAEYRDVSTWGTDPRRGFRPIMPPHFHKSRQAMRSQSNSLVAFLDNPVTADEDLIFGPSFYISQTEFIRCDTSPRAATCHAIPSALTTAPSTHTSMWKQKCSELGMRPTPWNADFYCTPFGRRGLRVEKKRLRYPPDGSGKMCLKEFVVGIGKRAFWEEDDEAATGGSGGGGAAENPAAVWRTATNALLAKTGSAPADDRSLAALIRAHIDRGGSLATDEVRAMLSDDDVRLFTEEGRSRRTARRDRA